MSGFRAHLDDVAGKFTAMMFAEVLEFARTEFNQRTFHGVKRRRMKIDLDPVQKSNWSVDSSPCSWPSSVPSSNYLITCWVDTNRRGNESLCTIARSVFSPSLFLVPDDLFITLGDVGQRRRGTRADLTQAFDSFYLFCECHRDLPYT